MSPRAVLVGLPGSGKSTAGRRLAKILVLPFADSDDLVEQRAGRAIAEIFAEDGESAFRRLEAEVIAGALTAFDGILALGGGAVTDAGTRELLRTSGSEVVWLRSDLVRLRERVSRSTARPLLAGDQGEVLARLAREREPLYREVATLTADGTGRNPSQLAAHVAARLHERAPR